MQIHKATAEYLGIKQNRQGMFEANADTKITLHDHQMILAKFQLDQKCYYHSILDHYKEVIYLMQKEINELKKQAMTKFYTPPQLIAELAKQDFHIINDGAYQQTQDYLGMMAVLVNNSDWIRLERAEQVKSLRKFLKTRMMIVNSHIHIRIKK